MTDGKISIAKTKAEIQVHVGPPASTKITKLQWTYCYANSCLVHGKGMARSLSARSLTSSCVNGRPPVFFAASLSVTCLSVKFFHLSSNMRQHCFESRSFSLAVRAGLRQSRRKIAGIAMSSKQRKEVATDLTLQWVSLSPRCRP